MKHSRKWRARRRVKNQILRNLQSLGALLGAVCLFAFFSVSLSVRLYEKAIAKEIRPQWLLSDSFREMQLNERYLSHLVKLCEKTGHRPGEFITLSMAYGKQKLPGKAFGYSESDYLNLKEIFWYGNQKGYEVLQEAYAAIWNDVVCFPVSEQGILYENTWMFERNYGGKRGHEGTDLIPPRNLPGHYQILSMTDGTVEKIGWLPRGGYRIGIRSPQGGYFYYAHLMNYAKNFYIGEKIHAGDILGTMGDTGYGPEGTSGKFAVHLHLGIYIRTPFCEEQSMNPYWVLRYSQLCSRKNKEDSGR